MPIRKFIRTGVRRSSFAFGLVVALSLSLAAGDAPHISKVEPPSWWADYVSPVMILLYGENLAGADVSVDYPGVHVDKIQTQPDGKHAFVWLSLGQGIQPGNAVLRVKTSAGETSANLPLLARPSPVGKYQGITPNDVIYLIMVDRFADGDASNNQPKAAAPGTYDRHAAKTYHGGDLKGVQQHLPYLKGLGVTTLWLTPLYKNDDSSSDYHGYHAVDEYAVEDHFGTLRDYQELVAAAHQ
jgi:1,4-alpha-glucan branching enzyme